MSPPLIPAASPLEQRLKTLRRVLLLAAGFWTGALAGLLYWAITTEQDHVLRYGTMEARANFNKDIAFRNWSAKRGGVYVEASEDTPPNPYLAHVPDRDIETPGGKHLTLMNPAYMLRQTMQEFSELYGIKGRITSLQPLNPANAPDAWERKVLESFDRGIEDVSEITTIDGKPYLRYMQAFVTREGCLKCHAHQGYRVGDVRGGVGVSVPLEPYIRLKDQRILTLSISYGLLWLLGLGGIGFGHRFAAGRIQDQFRTESDLASAKEVAQKLAEVDGLTGLYNRRFLDERLPQELRRAARESTPLGLVMLDLDGFKDYNDTMGHLAGDDALRAIATTLNDSLRRPADFIARYGGEEFCVVLPNTDPDGVERIAEQMRQAVQRLCIRRRSDGDDCLTISLGGCVERPAPDASVLALIHCADDALYTAKQQGKNRVVMK